MRVLGSVFSEYGRTPDPSHVIAINEMAKPQDQAAVRSFVGRMSYNRSYIPHYLEFIAHLNYLLRDDLDDGCIPALWKKDTKYGDHFKHCKAAITSAPCLITIDITKPFSIHVDACKNGRSPGAVLLQQNNADDLRPVSYYSYRRLRKGDRPGVAPNLKQWN